MTRKAIPKAKTLTPKATKPKSDKQNTKVVKAPTATPRYATFSELVQYTGNLETNLRNEIKYLRYQTEEMLNPERAPQNFFQRLFGKR